MPQPRNVTHGPEPGYSGLEDYAEESSEPEDEYEDPLLECANNDPRHWRPGEKSGISLHPGQKVHGDFSDHSDFSETEPEYVSHAADLF